MQRRREWELGWQRFFKDSEKMREAELIPFPDWKISWDDSYKIEFESPEQWERAKAMIEFCTEYENESFELFYKWFKQNKGKED